MFCRLKSGLRQFTFHHANHRPLFVDALYGLKSYGAAAWQSDFANSLRDLNFTPTYHHADADVWICRAYDSEDQYYEYIFSFLLMILFVFHIQQA